ncbi:MAG: lactate utilization protein [Sphaerochaetaceae bacterium]
MDVHRSKIREFAIERTMENLRKNNMEATFLADASLIVPTVRSMLTDNCSITLGGSSTVIDTGLLALAREPQYKLIDRYAPGLTHDQMVELFTQGFSADVMFTSANAITEHGELYCVDGTSNRTAQMLFGPKKVIVIAGWQKIVANLQDAVNRVKRVAAPANATRLKRDTTCVKRGYCIVPYCHDKHLMSIAPGACTKGICSNMVTFGRQAVKGRMHVLIVGEELGY